MSSKILFCILFFSLIFAGPIMAQAAPDGQEEQSIVKALDYLKLSQDEFGDWLGHNTQATIVSSTLAIKLLSAETNTTEAVANGKARLLQIYPVLAKSVDYMARLLPFVDDPVVYSDIWSYIKESANYDGGYGVRAGFETDALDTTLAVNTMLESKPQEQDAIIKGIYILTTMQNSDGGWPYIKGGTSKVFLTAEVMLALNYFSMKTQTASPLVLSALQEGASFLENTRQGDEWGLTESSLQNTIMAYRALIYTKGVQAVSSIKDILLNSQLENGSWFDSPYLTALAIQALKEEQQLSADVINSFTVSRWVDGGYAEADSYYAYDDVKISILYTSIDQNSVSPFVYIEAPGGDIEVLTRDDETGSYFWNTTGLAGGTYTVYGQLKKNDTGQITAAVQKVITITDSFEITGASISTDPKRTRINKPVEVSATLWVYKKSNITKTLTVTTEITAQNGTVAALSENQPLFFPVEGSEVQSKVITFNPEVNETQTYTIKTTIFDGNTTVTQAIKTFDVQPPLPPARIDLTQTLSKTWLYPGSDTVDAEFTLEGIGTPSMPDRKPIDMVFLVDESGSMSWDNRISYARSAATEMTDLLMDQDNGGLVGFTTAGYIKQNITGDKDLLRQKISQLRASGGTNIGAGIATTVNMIKAQSSSSRKKIIVLLSDGQSSYSYAVQQATIAAQNDITIHVLGIGSGADQNLLSEVARRGNGIYKFAATSQQIAEMMKEIGGEIFNKAGRDITLTITSPNTSLTITQTAPADVSIIDNNDSTKNAVWVKPDMVMGDMEKITLNLSGTNLQTDSTETATLKAVLSYIDENDLLETITLPAMTIPVRQHNVDSNITLDKEEYDANESAGIEVSYTNSSEKTVTFDIETALYDIQGNKIAVIGGENNVTFTAGERKDYSHIYNLPQGILADIYVVKTIGSQDGKILTESSDDFTILADGMPKLALFTDKVEYNASEDARIIQKVTNTSTNKVETDLVVFTAITDDQNNTLWEAVNSLPELLPNRIKDFTDLWNTGTTAPGTLTVTADLYRRGELLDSQNVTFTIAEAAGITALDGELTITLHEGDKLRDIDVATSITNTGNADLANVTTTVQIIDSETYEVKEVITRIIDLAIGETKTDIFGLSKEIYTGQFWLIYSAQLEGGEEFPLDSDSIYLKPYTADIMMKNEWNEWDICNTIYPQYRIYNTGENDIILSDIRIRYYFNDDMETPEVFLADWATCGAWNIEGTFYDLPGYAQADKYVEVTFKEAAGVIKPGEHIEIHTRILDIWNDFDQNNDYSFNKYAEDFEPWENITVHGGNMIIWGKTPRE